MQSTSQLQASGLNVSDNSLSVGSNYLTQADNIIIKRNNVIESRRGFSLYGNSFGTETDRASQLFSYKERILRHYNSVIQFDNGNGTFTSFSGSYSDVIAGLRMRSIEANGNLYITTSNGIQKIAARTAADFTSDPNFIVPAGGIKALDGNAVLKITLGNINDILPQDSAAAYRIVWGRNDINDNLILGTPSARIVIYNPLTDLIVGDLLNTLEALDNINQSPCLITDGNYVSTLKLPVGSTASQLKTNILGLAGKLDADIQYTNGTSVQVSTSQRTSTTGGTIVFNTPMTTYLSVGDLILGSSFTNTEFNNNILTINSISSATITVTPTTTFSTTDGSPVAESASSLVHSYNYTNIVNEIQADSISTLQNLVIDFPSTDQEVLVIQNNLRAIINRLKNELSGVIPTSLLNTYIVPINITTTAAVNITFTIPQGVDSNYFFQIYRSAIVSATGTTSIANIVPNDEMQLIYEAFPTPAELSAGTITVTDTTPPSFAGAFLYTNEQSGEGILQANDIPPLARDINRFKNVLFFSSTQTRFRMSLSLLGITKLIEDYNNNIIPTIIITDGITTSQYTFIIGIAQVTTITCPTAASVPVSGYFDINSTNNVNLYRFWYDTTGSDPAPSAGGRILVKIELSGFTTPIVTANQVATRTSDVISQFVQDFNSTFSTNKAIVTNTTQGYTASPTLGPGMSVAGFSLSIVSGQGENAALNQVLLSSSISPAIAVDETARSLVNVINLNATGSVYAYYLSTSNSVPGQMNIEARSLSTPVFYIVANNSNTGSSFSPNISPENTITNISTGAVTTITTTTAHGLTNGSQVVIMNTNSTPVVNGLYTVMNVTTFTFQIAVAVTVAGNTGQIISAVDAQSASNDVKGNRIYYSKVSQPEAVPIVNFVDVGAEDSAILRIFPLRESLFIFKEDGLFRLSGETAPWTVQLFDSSTKIIAADSIDVSNNLIYGWSKQGIVTVSESGVSLISRPIDTIVLPIGSDQYPNFSTATWGVGYESDNSYMVFTVTQESDILATQCYRYSNLTSSWTRFAKTDTCGVVNTDERLYLGAGDINFLEKERKSFDRTDYADREFLDLIEDDSVTFDGSVIKLPTVSNYKVGDVITQVQTLTSFQYNALLQKLDDDPTIAVVNISSSTTGLNPLITTNVAHNLSVGDTVIISNSNSTPLLDGTYKVLTVPLTTTFTIGLSLPITIAATSGNARMSYYGTLLSLSGDNMRTKIVDLAAKLDGDPNTVTKTYSSTIATRSGTIIANTANNPTSVTTSSNHNLFSGRIIAISGSNSSPSINGDQTVTVTSSNTFTLAINVLTAGTAGSYSTEDSNFNDIKACYNKLISLLNLDTGVTFGNYNVIVDTTLQEATIISINTLTRKITLDMALNWVVGPVIIFNSIISIFTYAPNVLGDPLTLKQVSEATMMFQDKAFSKAIMSFATDLQPEFLDVSIIGDGKGLFGFSQFGTGFFGGASSGAPFRTYIPRQCQRCRYILVQFSHKIAREKYAIYGSTLSGRTGISTRAYR